MNSSYSRLEALKDGVLIDVSDVAREFGFEHPVAMSYSLYNHPDIEPEHRTENIIWILRAMLIHRHLRFGTSIGESTDSLLVNNGDTVAIVRVRAIVEASPNGDGLIATLLEKEEVYDLQSPRASFYVV